MLRLPLVYLLAFLTVLAVVAVASAQSPQCANGQYGIATATDRTFAVGTARSYQLGPVQVEGSFRAELPRPLALIRATVSFPFRVARTMLNR